jgi:hypothetical protein
LYHLENLSPFQDILTKTAFISPPVEAGVFCGDRINPAKDRNKRFGGNPKQGPDSCAKPQGTYLPVQKGPGRYVPDGLQDCFIIYTS